MSAFLDCQQYSLVVEYGSNCFLGTHSKEFIDRLYRLKDASLKPLMADLTERCWEAPELLKSLLRQKAEDSHVRMVWDSIWNRLSENSRTESHCCSAPITMLKRLILEPSISIADVERMLGVSYSLQFPRVTLSEEKYILYTAIFWEASERVIGHLLDLVPRHHMLDPGIAWRLLFLDKYSQEFCRKLIDRFDLTGLWKWKEIAEFRPDLVTELGLSA